MGKSSEFDRDGDPSVKKVVTRTGPLGLVPNSLHSGVDSRTGRNGSLVEKLNQILVTVEWKDARASQD